MRPASTLSVITLAAALLTACGSDNAPTGAIEKRIRKDFADKTHLTAGEVKCPGNIKARKGARFDCTAKVDNQPIPVRVTLTDSSGSHFTFERTKAVILTSALTKGLQDQIKAQDGVDATVDCGAAKIVVKDPGEQFDCDVSGPAGAQKAHIQVKDIEGTVDFRLE